MPYQTIQAVNTANVAAQWKHPIGSLLIIIINKKLKAFHRATDACLVCGLFTWRAKPAQPKWGCSFTPQKGNL